MKNKVHILIIVPSIEMTFEFFVPINKKIGTIKKTIISFVQNEFGLSIKDNMSLIDKASGIILTEDVLVNDSFIKNGTKLILL